MRIRSELSFESNPCASEDLDWVNPNLINPDNAAELARVREHIMFQPRDVLLDTYQAVTELELKEQSGSEEAAERYLSGLHEELAELVVELEQAREENPHFKSAEPGGWMYDLLDRDRLRMTDILPIRKDKYLGELGDILWYSGRVAAEAGSTLSRSFLRFLQQSEAGPLLQRYRVGQPDGRLEDQASRILSFEWTQKISLAQKMAFFIGPDSPGKHKTTIDSNPGVVLSAIADGLPKGRSLEGVEPVIGKLVWFGAYTSSTLLNAEFSTVMKANLEKITARSRRGTTFSKKDRTEEDESLLRASRDPRAPLG